MENAPVPGAHEKVENFKLLSKKKNNSFSGYREYPLANSWQGKNLVF